MAKYVPPHPYDLKAYCAWLNNMDWVRNSGHPYFIVHNRETNTDELLRHGEVKDDVSSK